jgi:S-adenosylmethionine decarboxylase
MITARHKILSFIGCEICELTERQFEQAVRATDAKVIKTISHRFQPQGLSILTLLAESHASIHTYPEYDFCYLDIFTCGDMKLGAFKIAMAEILKPREIIEKTIDRSF